MKASTKILLGLFALVVIAYAVLPPFVYKPEVQPFKPNSVPVKMKLKEPVKPNTNMYEPPIVPSLHA